jgi:uncharacterized protein YfaS (alpha-2-macroglobulin family)
MHPACLPYRMCRNSSVLAAISTLFLISLAISSGGCKKGTALTTVTPTPPIATPTESAQLLPPALVETDPLPEEMIALKQPITFYFNQPMQPASVEAAITGEPALSGSFAWQDDATLTFTPVSARLPDTSQTINISTSAQSAKGMALQQPISLSYTTPAYLSLMQSLPADGSNEVDPTSAVVAVFNQPVVALGADPVLLPAGFTISPTANGKGEWLNTSTYIFYPEPALAGGTSYQVQLNPDLVSTNGTSLESGQSWSFRTVMPRLASTLPADSDDYVRLDTTVQLNFSYSMDAASVEENFSLQASNGSPIDGRSAWNDDFTTFTYTPTQLLARATIYQVVLSDSLAALGGTLLDKQQPISWTTYPDLSIISTEPTEGGVVETYAGIKFVLSSLVDDEQMDHFITITPGNPVFDGRLSEDQTVSLYWILDPDTDYTLTISPDLPDLWGGRLGQAYTLHFRTAPLPGAVEFPYDSEFIFLTTQDTGMMAQVTNESDIPITVGTLTINDLIPMLDLMNGESFRRSFIPHEAETWTFYPHVPRNQSTTVTLPISPNGQPRPPGLYYLCQSESVGLCYNPTILAVSHYQVILKLTPTEAFIWAVDLDTNTPADDSPVTVYDRSGRKLASGITDSKGVFHTTILEYAERYRKSFAVLGQPGEDNFGFAFSDWNEGVGLWNFGIWTDYSPQEDFTYIYTDRPIYRPGDTVYFRLVARQAFNGRYSLPEMGSYPLVLNGPDGEQLASFELPLSGFATAQAEYTLPENAQPGTYELVNPDESTRDYSDRARVNFEVAEYRKPEIDLQVTFESSEVLSQTVLAADINARYFFDAPAGNLPIHWVLYSLPAYFHIPNYQVGPVDTSWLMIDKGPPYVENALGLLGYSIANGDARLDANGLTSISLPTPDVGARQKYTLEVSLTDESGLPVYARDSIFVNPGDYYIGVDPDSWSYAAQAEAGFNILVADLTGSPAGARRLTAKFQRVEWERHDPSPAKLQYWYPRYEAKYTLIMSTTFSTNADGTARLTFTPPEPGAYQLDVSGDDTLTQVIVWVKGAGQGVYPSLPNQRIRLVADQDAYKPGDTAQIFIPNPFVDSTLALLTVERGTVMHHQILHLEPGGSTAPLLLEPLDAPNVYVTVTLLGQDGQGHPDFRQGYVNLTVDPSAELLKVTLTSQPERAGPREPVTFDLHISDAYGSPVQGEFSLSVVDSAVLSLAEPNVADILSAFYGLQKLNVETGISLAAWASRVHYQRPGAGYRPGAALGAVTRENFPDTAYWNAQIVTDENGNATVNINLPDTLTTWQVLVRGLTKETRVGETQLKVISTKDLVIRPVTPRFMVVGDHAMLAAVVQNNIDQQLQGSATLQATGFTLDDPDLAIQPVTVPANGRVRLEWWGSVDDVSSASLRFAVQAGGLQDAVLVAKGALPVLRYTAPQTFATSGSLAEQGQRLELVSLPMTFDANSGSLDLELDPSLTTAMIAALGALENYPYGSTEGILSRFLPNLVTYTTLQSFAIYSPDLKARLDRTLTAGLERLLTLQNADGGWGWWPRDDSDAYITAYVLFGLAKAKQAGFAVPEGVIDNAMLYINNKLVLPSKTSPSWELDRMAFELFALKQAGAVNQAHVNNLDNVRDQLSPWAKAMLALSSELTPSVSEQVPALISNLQATAIRSATGVHWEVHHPDWRNMTSTLTNSAIVIYALAQLKPDSTLLPDAVNYLMSNRQPNGCWRSSYESAWTLLAMDEVLKGTGELNSNYAFSAALNDTTIVTGVVSNQDQLHPLTTSLPVANLDPHSPNALVIERQSGVGRLYYTAALNVSRPAEDVAQLDRGISVSRGYYPPGSDLTTATPVDSAQAGNLLTVRLTIIVPTDVYHFVVEDYIPAGTEILNTNLKTSQLGVTGESGSVYDPHNPYSRGWGWWLFNDALIYDDHISWTASYLPAGTYELIYTLTAFQPGEYHLLPARAWMLYFPEVQGNSAGGLMEIRP